MQTPECSCRVGLVRPDFTVTREKPSIDRPSCSPWIVQLMVCSVTYRHVPWRPVSRTLSQNKSAGNLATRDAAGRVQEICRHFERAHGQGRTGTRHPKEPRPPTPNSHPGPQRQERPHTSCIFDRTPVRRRSWSARRGEFGRAVGTWRAARGTDERSPGTVPPTRCKRALESSAGT